GMATATATSTAAALGVAAPAALMMPSPAEVELAASIAVAGLAAFATLAVGPRLFRGVSGSSGSSGSNAVPMDLSALKKGGDGKDAAQQQPVAQQQQLQPLELGAEVVAGVIFALGLGLSGMTRPSKVAGFLQVGWPAWDPSLPFVMGGAVLVAMAAYQAIMRFKIMPKPILCKNFQIPTSSLIDRRLLAGGVLFGAGWGLAGMCPGPALVASVTGSPHVLAYVGAMAAGMLLETRASARWGARK
ncbi:hypothetical protein Agub_g13008, partial [Astrephomene gubernaculifera]